MIKTIIFDIGRVLVDWDWESYVKRIIPDEEKAIAVGKGFFGSPYYIEFDRGVLTSDEVLGKIIADNPQFESEFRLVFSRYGESITLRDFVIPWIKSLKERGFKVLYLSNYAVPMRMQTAEQLRFTEFTDGGIFSCDVKTVKPDSKIYELLLKKYDLKAEECIFIDDTPENVRGAQNVGINGIQYITYEQVCDDMEKLINGSN